MVDLMQQDLDLTLDCNFDPAPNEIPDDLQSFDIDEFLGLQPDISGSEIDVDVLLPGSYPKQPPPVTQELSPNSDDSGFFSPHDSTVHKPSLYAEALNQAQFFELTTFDPSGHGEPIGIYSAEQLLSPRITYAVISENRPEVMEPVTIGPIPETDIELQANHVSDDVINESDIEFDEEDPLSDDVIFSGSKTSTLPTSYDSVKSHQVHSLTEEEKDLLALEGVRIPENVPLTKMEERVLKKVRRKLRNRQSAHVSRQKKKDYIKNLELRVKKCTDQNSELQIKIGKLELQNSTLVQQLSHLKSMITHKMSSAAGAKNGRSVNATTGTCLMMVVFSCCLLMMPMSEFTRSEQTVASYDKNMASVMSRTLLNAPPEDAVEALKTSTNYDYPDEATINISKKLNVDQEELQAVTSAQQLEEASKTNYDDIIASQLQTGPSLSESAQQKRYLRAKDL